VGAAGAAPLAGGAPSGAQLVEHHRSGRALPAAAADDAPEQYHLRSRLVPGGGAAERAAGEAFEPPRGDTPSSRLELPLRPPPETTIEAAIGARRSARRFAPAAIAAADLGFVLDAARGHPRLERAPGVALRVFAHRVEGVPAGLYLFDRDAAALAPVRTGFLADALVAACLGQDKAGEAAVGIAMVGAIEASAARRGDRAYRDLCIECGAIGQRIYLAAEALGLAARNLAAFTDARMNDLAGVDGRREAVLHLTMLGHGD
jgi:SagB-type dehydrogenase family enzyme